MRRGWRRKQLVSKFGVKMDDASKRARTVDGVLFHSQGECDHYLELKLREKAKEIFKLRLQPKFEIIVAGKHICNYISDFGYFLPGEKIETIDDFKGEHTREFKLKFKLVKALFGDKYNFILSGNTDGRKRSSKRRSKIRRIT